LLKPSPPAPRQRPWSSFAISAAAHVLILLTAAGLTRHRAAVAEDEQEKEQSASPRVDMIYVPPVAPAPPPPPAQPPRPSPPPPTPRRAPEPEPNAPPDAKPAAGTESDNDNPPVERNAESAPTWPVPAAEKPAATMESEARRIFGRPKLATRAGAGPQAVRPMEAWMPERSERCIPTQPEASDSVRSQEFGTVEGKIYRQDNGRPLAGAHLQMVGTPYVAFTDGSGAYRFRFDLSLAGNCRTQYVKVTAAGYESRLLVLVLGPNRSEDVHLRRR
jgi:hypothetical protein